MKKISISGWKNKLTEILGVMVILVFLAFLWKTDQSGAVAADRDVRYITGWKYLQAEEGESYTISSIIPKDGKETKAIAFRSQQQKVSVFVDGEAIYQYPEREFMGGVIPSIWNLIKLPENSGGKEIQIQFSSPYQRFSGKIGEVYYGTYNDLLYSIHRKQFVPLLTGALVGIMGIFIILLTISFRKYRTYQAEERLGMLFIFASLWLCGESRYPFETIGAEAQYYITFLSLAFCPIFFLAYLEERVRGKYRKLTKRFLLISVLFSLYYIVLQSIEVRTLVEMVGVMHFILIVSLVYGIFVYGDKIKNKEAGYSRIEFLCMTLIFLSIVIEVILFYADRSYIVGICVRTSFMIYTVYLLIASVFKIYRTMMSNVEMEKELHESQIRLMKSQIQPHFIYNTLNSIRVLIRISPDDAYRMVYDFSTYLRANIDSISNRTEILFSEELKHIKAYVNIEKVRFQDRLEVIYDIEEEAFYLPPLSVQPIVENAIKHGICKKAGGGCVWIRSYGEQDCYVVEVEDNGIGFEKESGSSDQASKISTGLDNIEFRLKEIGNARLKIESELKKGTKATIKFPKK